MSGVLMAAWGVPTRTLCGTMCWKTLEMVIFSGCDPEATGLGMSGGIALEMPKWLKKAGIKIVSISPDLNYASAVHADTWIPIKPNTDAALYLAVAHNWIAEDTYDKAYVASHTIGFDAFRAHVLGEDDGIEKTPKWGEEMTGVPAHTIKALAREWARKKTTLSVYFGGPKVRGTLSHLSARMEAYVLAMQGIGSPGQQFLNRCAVFLQERPGAGAALSRGRFPAVCIEPNDRIRHRPRTGIAVLRTAYPGRRSDPQRSDRMEKHYLCAGEDRRPVQNIPVPAVAGSPRHPHGMERKTAASPAAGGTGGSGSTLCAVRRLSAWWVFTRGSRTISAFPTSSCRPRQHTSTTIWSLCSEATSSGCSIRIRRSRRLASRC